MAQLWSSGTGRQGQGRKHTSSCVVGLGACNAAAARLDMVLSPTGVLRAAVAVPQLPSVRGMDVKKRPVRPAAARAQNVFNNGSGSEEDEEVRSSTRARQPDAGDRSC